MPKRYMYASFVALLLFSIGVVTWWLVPQESDSAYDVQAAVKQACDAMVLSDYDVTTTLSVPGIVGRMESRHSRNDLHRSWTSHDLEGNLLARGESILKAGTMFTRVTIDGAPSQFRDWEVVEDWPDPELLPCLPAHSAMSYEDLEVGEERTFSYTLFLSEQEGSQTRQFWVDSSGRPTRGRRTTTPPSSAASNAASSDTQASALVFDETYSGYGEPNIIVAPIGVSIPTPTPAPPTATPGGPTPTPAPPTATPQAWGTLAARI